MTEFFLPATGLDFGQARLLTGLVQAFLRDFHIPDEVQLLRLNGDCVWWVRAEVEEAEKQILLEALEGLPVLAGARYLGSGPLAFHLAKRDNIPLRDYNRHCLSYDYVNPDDWNLKLTGLQTDTEGLWGRVEVEASDPYLLLAHGNTGAEDYTIVRWKDKHYHSAEEYLQLKARGLLREGLIL